MNYISTKILFKKKKSISAPGICYDLEECSWFVLVWIFSICQGQRWYLYLAYNTCKGSSGQHSWATCPSILLFAAGGVMCKGSGNPGLEITWFLLCHALAVNPNTPTRNASALMYDLCIMLLALKASWYFFFLSHYFQHQDEPTGSYIRA